MAMEKEYLAMRSIDRAFTSLKTEEDRERLVKWTADKYSPALKIKQPQAPVMQYQQPAPIHAH